MNYQIRTILHVQGISLASPFTLPGSNGIYGSVAQSDKPLAGDVILSCRNLTTPGDTLIVFHRDIVVDGQLLQVSNTDLSTNTYLLVIGMPIP